MNKYIFYLAAGNSRRFGSNKLLYPYEGKPLYRHGLDMLEGLCQERDDCRLTVVSQYEEILEDADRRGLSAVYSPDSKRGMSYTIRTAIESLFGVREEDFLLFVVADQPHLTAKTVSRLLDRAADTEEAASVSWNGVCGNPVLFSAKLIPALLSLKGDEGGRKALKGRSCVLVEADEERELEDIDTKQAIGQSAKTPRVIGSCEQ